MNSIGYQKLQRYINRGSLWDPRIKEIHTKNQHIKKMMRQSGVTQKEVSEMIRMPKKQLSKALNSWYPMPQWLIDEIMVIISKRSNS